MDKLSVVLVNYNCGSFLIECLNSLDKVKGGVDLEIWVVDNASEDDSLEETQKLFPKLNYIENQENLGFGAANNQALRKITTELILLLNPDTQVEKNTLPYMVNFMKEHPDVGASTCRGLKNDRTLDLAYHRGFPTPWVSLLYFLGNDSLYHLTDRNMEEAHEVDAISGSFFMTRKSVLNQIGIFDEDYWLYGEDLDLCFRMKQAGFKIMYVPKVVVIHHKGISSGIKEHSQEVTTAKREARLKAFNSFYETMKIFYKKHLASKYPLFINQLVYWAIDLKWFLARRKLHV